MNMKETNDVYLDTLKNIIPKEAYGANATMFAIALEGWRRGLTLKFYKAYINERIKIRYALSNGNKTIDFQLSLAQIVPKDVRRITKSKEATKKYLIANNVPTPKGRGFSEEDSDEEIINYVNDLEYPLVLKPTNASLGIGVTTNISDRDTFIKKLKHLRNVMGYKEIIVEEQVDGEDTRLFIVDNSVVGAFKRIPSNVVGNGKNSIKELIELQNNLIKNNPHGGDYRIEINEKLKKFVTQAGYSLNYIPENGQRINLNSSTIHSQGGQTVDVTDDLSEKTKKIAISAVKALPELPVCGVDIMVDKNKDTNFVLELNSRPNIGGGLFPMTGKGRDVSKAIVDYYFPETKAINPNVLNFYFDYNKVVDVLHRGAAKEVIIPNHPKNSISKRMVVYGNVQGVGFRNMVYKKAVGKKLSGFVLNEKSKKVTIVVAGEEAKVESFTEEIKEYKGRKINVDQVLEQKWEKPVKIGFEIIKNSSKTTRSKKELSKEKDRIQQLKRDCERLQKKLDKMEKSNSWKITKPLRNVAGLLKR
ncbi:acylphosphatase [Virgibacillus sp. Bac330]|uniref:acylphosphatase n=1 Tax=Virgibacillus sp. Bac330 TaxID=2419841 RepID=UPI000EF4747A|nr:acylphosphatase [Virgibacillus sp. Bac330]